MQNRQESIINPWADFDAFYDLALRSELASPAVGDEAYLSESVNDPEKSIQRFEELMVQVEEVKNRPLQDLPPVVASARAYVENSPTLGKLGIEYPDAVFGLHGSVLHGNKPKKFDSDLVKVSENRSPILLPDEMSAINLEWQNFLSQNGLKILPDGLEVDLSYVSYQETLEMAGMLRQIRDGTEPIISARYLFHQIGRFAWNHYLPLAIAPTINKDLYYSRVFPQYKNLAHTNEIYRATAIAGLQVFLYRATK